MSAAGDPVEAYLQELRERLGVRGRRRQRIVDEIAEHLRDAIEAEAPGCEDASRAALAAIARLGPAHELAGRFKELRRGRKLTISRALAPWALAAGASALATATVWAFQPGSEHLHHVRAPVATATRCASATPHGGASRHEPPASPTRVACVARPGARR
jgi:hypothetical protein